MKINSFSNEEIRTASASSIHTVANSFESKFSVAFRYAFARARKAIKPLLEANQKVETRALATIKAALMLILPGMLAQAAAAGGQIALEPLSLLKAAAKNDTFKTQFNAKNPQVIEWAKHHAGDGP